jgi:hypothetical protein
MIETEPLMKGIKDVQNRIAPGDVGDKKVVPSKLPSIGRPLFAKNFPKFIDNIPASNAFTKKTS